MNNQNNLTEEEAKEIVAGDYGKALRELSFQFALPICWKKPKSTGIEINHGTIFFINTGNKIFAVTANHVFEEYLNAKGSDNTVMSQLGNMMFDLQDRLIANNKILDIATFNISQKELNNLGRVAFRGSQKTWPPEPPSEGQPVFFGGFPKIERTTGGKIDIDFGLSFVLCLASNVTSQKMTCQLERDYLVPIKGSPELPKDYFWAGASGAPVIKIVRTPIETFQLAGVVSGCWNNDTITVSHVAHINMDGTLNEHNDDSLS